MKKITQALSLLSSVLYSTMVFAFNAPLPITTANPVPASKVYFCGGGTEYYNTSDNACHFYMAGNILGKTDHSDITGWPTPARKPNYAYDDVKGNYVSVLMGNQFNFTLSGNAAEKLTMACPTGTSPTSASVSGTAVSLGGGAGGYVVSGAITTLSQLSVLCK